VDVVTPLPGSYISFLWALLSKPTHCIRVRIAEAIVSSRSTAAIDMLPAPSTRKSNYNTNYLDTMDPDSAMNGDDGITAAEKALLDHVGESLARLGRVKRVGLGVKDKHDFVRKWTKTRSTW
jgi:hypothetical protein